MNNISWQIKGNNNEWINILKPNEIASRQKQGPREAIQVFSFGGEDKSWRDAVRRGRIHRIRASYCSVLPCQKKERKNQNHFVAGIPNTVASSPSFTSLLYFSNEQDATQ